MLLDKKIPLSYLTKKVKRELIFSSLAILIIVLSKTFLNYNLKIPVAIPAFLGTSISLLLSFKLAQSYDRWWEARKVWGAIVNDSRFLAVQVRNFANTNNMKLSITNINDIIKNICFRQIAWCYSLSYSLKKIDPCQKLTEFLTDEEIKAIKHHKNIPLKLMDINSRDINTLFTQGIFNEYQQIQIDTTLTKLCDSMGKSERIKNTVFPKTYRIFLRLFIYIFIAVLTFSLYDMSWWSEIMLLLIISTPFFLLKKTAHYMQDPFDNKPTDIPTYTVSQTIEINIKQLLNEKNLPKLENTDNVFYVM